MREKIYKYIIFITNYKYNIEILYFPQIYKYIYDLPNILSRKVLPDGTLNITYSSSSSSLQYVQHIEHGDIVMAINFEYIVQS